MNYLKQKLVVISVILMFFWLPFISYAALEMFGGKITRRYDVLTETFLKVKGKSGGFGSDSIVWAIGPMKACFKGQSILGYGLNKKVAGTRVTLPLFGLCLI